MLPELNITMPTDVADLLKYIHFDTEVTILFKNWKITTLPGFIASCLAVVCFAALYILLKTYRKHRSAQAARAKPLNMTTETDSEWTTLLTKLGKGGLQILRMEGAAKMLLHLHLGKKLSTYILTLIVVTFNGWLILSILIGIAVGYMASPWQESTAEETTDTEDHD